MAPTTYSGALQPKKKSELIEIALALRLSDQGTKDEIQARIKRHLDNNQDALEDDPVFAGLFGRRKRSLQPQPIPSSGRFAPPVIDAIEKPRSSTGRRVAGLDPIKESTPPKDLRDVSTFLKRPPFSPPESTPTNSPRPADVDTPSSLPPLPPSPIKAIIQHMPSPSKVKDVVKVKQQEVIHNGYELLASLRLFLSNSRNVWSLSAVCELLYIISVIVPWKSVQIPLSSKGDSGFSISLVYPPLSVFHSSAFWTVLIHWAIPTLFFPTLVGSIVSFNPKNIPAPSNTPNSSPATPFDPLTSSIVRLAAQSAYPYDKIGSHSNIVGLDVLGHKWRVLSASVGLAFAFAEAIAGAPHQALEKSLIRQDDHSVVHFTRDARENTPLRRALMAEEERDEIEVD